MNFNCPPIVIRKKQVLALTGYSKSNLYNRINAKLFCPPVPLSCRTVGFIYKEVETVMQAIIAGYSEEHLQELVKLLIDIIGRIYKEKLVLLMHDGWVSKERLNKKLIEQAIYLHTSLKVTIEEKQIEFEFPIFVQRIAA